jgi:hypothetical protein
MDLRGVYHDDIVRAVLFWMHGIQDQGDHKAGSSAR